MATTLKTFRGDQLTILQHVLYTDDDRVECTNANTGELILTYYANCNVYDASSNLVARSYINSENDWYFEKEDGTIIETYCGHDLLKAEVQFSKLYFEGLV